MYLVYAYIWNECKLFCEMIYDLLHLFFVWMPLAIPFLMIFMRIEERAHLSHQREMAV